jgi:hypothetical protein
MTIENDDTLSDAPAPITGRDHVCSGSISGTVSRPARRIPAGPLRVLIAEDDPVSRTVLDRSSAAGDIR